jgi:hypothetical protein
MIASISGLRVPAWCSGLSGWFNVEEYRMQVYCGIDWAEGHHDVALVDQHGVVVAKRRIGDDAAGFGQLMALLAEHGDSPAGLVPVAIETSRGLLVACLRGTGRSLYVINPLAVSRYRDRYSVAGKKSDHGDAVVLANIIRTDAHAHRPLPADTELVQAIAVLARAQPAGPDRLIEMLKLLWQGQSRRGGSPNSRRQTQAEAEAAVHLAANRSSRSAAETTVAAWQPTGNRTTTTRAMDRDPRHRHA